MFKTIVVGTDGSDASPRAVRLAAELAGATDGAVLHIVSVGKPSAAGADSQPGPRGVPRSELETDTTATLATVVHRAAQQVADTAPGIETHARRGNPAEMLCELADQLGADLLVVGNRGMQGGRRFIGSVPNSVSHHAPCSVLIADTTVENDLAE